MSRLTSRMVKAGFFMVVVLPGLIGGCTDNIWATTAVTAATTGVATLVDAVAQAIAARIIPVAQ